MSYMNNYNEDSREKFNHQNFDCCEKEEFNEKHQDCWCCAYPQEIWCCDRFENDKNRGNKNERTNSNNYDNMSECGNDKFDKREDEKHDWGRNDRCCFGCCHCCKCCRKKDESDNKKNDEKHNGNNGGCRRKRCCICNLFRIC